MKSISLSNLLALIELSSEGIVDKEQEFKAILSIEDAIDGSITFITNDKYVPELTACKASALITSKKYEQFSGLQIVHPNPYWAFAKVAQFFHQEDHGKEQIHPEAYVDSTAVIGKHVRIFPNVYVGAKATIQDHAVLYPGVYVGNNAVIGKRTVLRANVVIETGCQIGNDCLLHACTVIGSDGFGFAPKPPNRNTGDMGEVAKIPQVGSVIIEDTVEIGSGCTVDRGAMGSTRIGAGTKLDNQVHIGHNSVLGKNNIICGKVAVAGSTTIGDWVTVAGSADINGHITVADGVTVGGKAGVTKSITEPGSTYMGFPAYPAKVWKKQQVYLRRLAKEKS